MKRKTRILLVDKEIAGVKPRWLRSRAVSLQSFGMWFSSQTLGMYILTRLNLDLLCISLSLGLLICNMGLAVSHQDGVRM